MLRRQLEKGLVQVYTGEGKGKSTASFGLALRAFGQGFRVYIIQFLKTAVNCGEVKAFRKLYPEVIIKSFGRKGFINKGAVTPEDLELARKAMEEAARVLADGDADLLILDEICNALYYNLITTEEVVDLVRKKPKHVELILTGRNCPSELIEIADLVTEMKEIKHPYRKGIGSRRGIEY